MGKRVTVYFLADEFDVLADKAASANIRIGPFCRSLLQGNAAIAPKRNVQLCTALTRNRANFAQVEDHLAAATQSQLEEPLVELLEEARNTIKAVRFALVGVVQGLAS